MKKIATRCLLGALCLAVAACNDDKEDDGGFSGTMTVNGQQETVKSAFYVESPANDRNEAYFQISLLKDAYSQMPENDLDYHVTISLTESLYGKTLDLTQPIRKSGALDNGMSIAARNAPNTHFRISYTVEGKINVISGEVDTTVTSGVLTVTRSGDDFAIKFSMTLSDGNSVAADWKGTATKLAHD